jgi:acyl-CoA thioester hydrolase
MHGQRGGIPAPFTGHAANVRPEWIDENGHMNMAYYVVVFDGAIDHLWPAVGLGETYRRSTQHGTFAVEAHIHYRAELLLGDRVHVTTQILGADEKRIHLAHEMTRDDTGAVVAQQEVMLLHVNLVTRRVVPFLPEAADLVAAGAQAHAALPRPAWVGRTLAMPEARRPA